MRTSSAQYESSASHWPECANWIEPEEKWLRMKKTAPHGAPRRDIRSTWCQLLCTGLDLVARVVRPRLPYTENLVSGAGLAYMRQCAFLGRACTRGAIMRRASTAGSGATTWVRGVGVWRRGWAASVGGVLLAAGRACAARKCRQDFVTWRPTYSGIQPDQFDLDNPVSGVNQTPGVLGGGH